MKHLAKMFYLVLFALVMQNCTEKEDAAPTKEKVQFSLDLKTIPNGASLRVSIQKSSGESVLNLQEVELLDDAGIIKTVPLELATGNYKISDFLIVNTENQISFATPKKGSAMAGQVKNPVDLSFSVQKGLTSKVAMEVINVANSLPANFGYTTFELNIIHPLKVVVSVPYLGSQKITNAKAYILVGADTLQKFNISPKVNLLPFKEEPNQSCTLVIVKDGYARYSRNFVYDSLMTTLAGAPLKITLTPAFTFLAYNDLGILNPYSITIGGHPTKTISVDWGDGTSDSYSFNVDGVVYPEHNYPATGNYFVSVTGALNDVTSFYSYYGAAMIDKLNLEHLPNLDDLTFGLTRSPEVIDLTHNTKISFLNLAGLYKVKTINLPVNNYVHFIHIGGDTNLTNASFNDIISKVHASAVKNGQHNGYFNFPKSWSQEEFDPAHIGTLTAASSAMLLDLRDNYGWSLYPDLD